MAKQKSKGKSKASGVPNLGGRPPYFDTPEQFTEAADKYFAWCIAERRPFTVTGLALFCGFSSIQSLNDTAKRDGFSEPVKKAKLVVEMGYEENLSGANATGSIFALKNFGWKDKQEHDVTNHNDLDSMLSRIKGADDGE